MFTGTGGLDGGVERQQVGLAGNVGNDAGDVADLGNGAIELVDGLIGGRDGFDNAVGRSHALADVGIALVDLGLRVSGCACRVVCVGGDFLYRLAKFFGRCRNPFDAGLLLLRLGCYLMHLVFQQFALAVNGVRGTIDLVQHRLQRALHDPEITEQQACFIAAADIDFIGQFAFSNSVKLGDCLA